MVCGSFDWCDMTAFWCLPALIPDSTHAAVPCSALLFNLIRPKSDHQFKQFCVSTTYSDVSILCQTLEKTQSVTLR